MRVVRAFVREPVETRALPGRQRRAHRDRAARRAALRADVPDRDARAQRLQCRRALVRRVPGRSGELQIGSLIAFLSYLIQILMAVMMATFMAVLLPRAAVSADRIGEVLDTESSVRPPENGVTELTSTGQVELRGRDVLVPRRRAAGAARRQLHREARADHGHHRQHRRRQDDAGQPAAAPVRRDRRRRAHRRRRRARDRPRHPVGSHRAGAAAGLPVLGHRGEQPAIRQSGCDGRGALERRSRSPRAATSSRRCRSSSRRRSRRAARTCPAGSANDSRSRERS